MMPVHHRVSGAHVPISQRQRQAQRRAVACPGLRSPETVGSGFRAQGLSGPRVCLTPKPVPFPEDPEMEGAGRERGPTTPLILETVPLPGSRWDRATAVPTASFYLRAHASLCNLLPISASSWNEIVSQGSARPTDRARRHIWASPGAFSPCQMSGSRPHPGRPGGAAPSPASWGLKASQAPRLPASAQTWPHAGGLPFCHVQLPLPLSP